MLIKAVKMTDKGLGLHSACNVTRKSSDKLQLLTLFPFFNVKNPSQYAMSPLAGFAVSGKDQFYRMFNSGNINWRDLAYRIFGRLRRVMEHEGESDCPTCLIVDDTDLIKRGLHIEMIGKVFSHVTHTFNLGYKMLALCFDDGKQLLNVDFSLHGEKGRKKNYGLTDKQLKNRKHTVRDSGSPDMERVKDYYETKVDTLIGMVRRFACHGHKADYLLADSWFTCAELVRFIKRLHCVGHYLGMVKSGNTKYIVNGKEICQLINDIAVFLDVDEDLLLQKYLSDTENFTKLINLGTLQQTG